MYLFSTNGLSSSCNKAMYSLTFVGFDWLLIGQSSVHHWICFGQGLSFFKAWHKAIARLGDVLKIKSGLLTWKPDTMTTEMAFDEEKSFCSCGSKCRKGSVLKLKKKQGFGLRPYVTVMF